ncbi:hypothetical protein D3C87_1789420 [compost metagenome]
MVASHIFAAPKPWGAVRDFCERYATSLPERGKYALTVKGKIAALVNPDSDFTIVVGAGAGFGKYLTPTIRFAT